MSTWWHRADQRKHAALKLWRTYEAAGGRYAIWQGRPDDPHQFVYRLEFPSGATEDFRLLNDAKRRGRQHADNRERTEP